MPGKTAREHADYKVATVQWMGYALFHECMVPLDDFIREHGGSVVAE